MFLLLGFIKLYSKTSFYLPITHILILWNCLGVCVWANVYIITVWFLYRRLRVCCTHFSFSFCPLISKMNTYFVLLSILFGKRQKRKKISEKKKSGNKTESLQNSEETIELMWKNRGFRRKKLLVFKRL